MSKVIMYTDGASRGNPGPASFGVWICQEGEAKSLKFVEELKGYLGTQTNNFAEYTAVIQALHWAQAQNIKEVIIRSDSELLVKQLTGVYKVKSDVIKPLFQEVKDLIQKKFVKVSFEHVRREFNREADRLANEALDEL